ncbi:MAG: HlyC/CorC family transporter [Rhodocyclaceae bacterium]|nr:HlyC/CorC family transporter [Rhodocyclaceae bacterium]
MDDYSPLALAGALITLLLLSAFFSMSETGMMAANRYRLRHAAQQGHRGARIALALLERTDRLLGAILLGNNLVNAGIATLIGALAIHLFGEDEWALSAATAVTTFLILVCSEITPKVIAASHADRMAPTIAFLLWPILKLFHPVVWAVNLFSRGLLALLRLSPKKDAATTCLSVEELRAIVLESAHFVPAAHRDILTNLFELEQVTVGDIMTPRGAIESIDLSAPIEEIRDRLATSFHTRLPVYEKEPGNIIGILHLRHLLGASLAHAIDHETLRASLVKPYFVPAGTAVYEQLNQFRANRQRLALVVDEYGELLGLVTVEDIVEEIVGKFTPDHAPSSYRWDEDGAVLVDASAPIRALNRALGLKLPVSGPTTLNGLITEHLQDIPDADVCVRIAGVAMEIIQSEDRRIRRVKILRPTTHG